MVHLRIVAPRALADRALEGLRRSPSVVNVIVLRGASVKPDGDVVLCDVVREDASVVIDDLRRAGIPRSGAIAVEEVDTLLSDAAETAERSASGTPADAVIWEEVTRRTSEDSTFSATFVAFMVLAMFIAAVGIFLDSPILIVGAMVVGPEFGPIAALCVALVQRRGDLAVRSLVALALGFPLGILATMGLVAAFRATGVTPEQFRGEARGLAGSIANPDFLSFFVAFCAGIAGMLSLTTAKSGALIGVLISVTTIPAAANVAVSLVYGDGAAARGSAEQLLLNIVTIHFAGLATLTIQRGLYDRRRRRHRAAMAARGVTP